MVSLFEIYILIASIASFSFVLSDLDIVSAQAVNPPAGGYGKTNIGMVYNA